MKRYKCQCGCGTLLTKRGYVKGHAWKGFNVTFKNKHPKEYKKIHTRIGKIGGKASQIVFKEKGLGFFNKENQSRWGKKGGKKSAERDKKNKVRMFDPKWHKIYNKKAIETQRKNKVAFFDPETWKKGGIECHKKHPDQSAKILKKLRENKPYWYCKNAFDSGLEREVAKLLHRNGMPIQNGKTVHVKVGSKTFDFRVFGLTKFGIKDGTFIEFHPWDMNNRTKKEYYEEREKALRLNGFENKLIVIFSLRAFEEKYLRGCK